MNQISVYPITPNLWRWEIRGGDALFRCGTASTRGAAERAANDLAHLIRTPEAFLRTGIKGGRERCCESRSTTSRGP